MKIITTLILILFATLVHANPVREYQKIPVRINIEHYNSESLTCLTKAIYF